MRGAYRRFRGADSVRSIDRLALTRDVLSVDLVSSTTRLLVLGVVRMFQPVHGYDVRRELVSWHAEEWANVAPGSIYNALKSLARDGLLEVEGTDQVGARPERTTYRITPRGESEMMELLRETLWQVQMPVDPLVAALSLMWYLDRKELISALEGRTAKIKGDLAHAKHAIEAIDDIETPIHVRAMMQLLNARLAAEIAWSETFRAELANGMYRTKGDPGWAPPGVHVAAMKSDSYTGPREARRAAKGAPKTSHSASEASSSKASRNANANTSHDGSAASNARTTGPVPTPKSASKSLAKRVTATRATASKARTKRR